MSWDHIAELQLENASDKGLYVEEDGGEDSGTEPEINDVDEQQYGKKDYETSNQYEVDSVEADDENCKQDSEEDEGDEDDLELTDEQREELRMMQQMGLPVNFAFGKSKSAGTSKV
ncbi:hypothetical protein DPMN_055264 [Dreissena polymorpha]|uniref:Uncharacterized protein n=1 Tax=Dreissena polymorpha TaxID=45954 RepID=A0A9D4HSD2_DREPO|nr:hypothetical protein DPMN_055264 [Dreissena polymorpha]